MRHATQETTHFFQLCWKSGYEAAGILGCPLPKCRVPSLSPDRPSVPSTLCRVPKPEGLLGEGPVFPLASLSDGRADDLSDWPRPACGRCGRVNFSPIYAALHSTIDFLPSSFGVFRSKLEIYRIFSKILCKYQKHRRWPAAGKK